VGLPDCLDWEVSRLSTGERQRLAIVRALELSPRALLLDEPTAALDNNSTAVVEGLLADRLSSGMSILLVTHDPRQATRMGDRSLMMKEGKLQEFMGIPS
jgi:ABC-type phosphate transport system ATPase subunit